MCSDGNVLDKRDGLVLNYQSLPKTNPQGTYEEGDTAVHEVGHWLGLPHTFGSASTCDDGDAVTFGEVTISDTPAEATAAFGCPIGRDSCPDAAGLDPIHNFMDYTNVSLLLLLSDKLSYMYEYLRVIHRKSNSHLLHSSHFIIYPTKPGLLHVHLH